MIKQDYIRGGTHGMHKGVFCLNSYWFLNDSFSSNDPAEFEYSHEKSLQVLLQTSQSNDDSILTEESTDSLL